MTQEERRLYLIKWLQEENGTYRGRGTAADETRQKKLLRGLMNMRAPSITNVDFLAVQDAYLKEAIKEKGITDVKKLEPVEPGGRYYIWQGDITTLKCDAIVNAANSGLTGCYIPNHGCIDNCIHTYAGVQLRLECDNIMQAQGYPEPVGTAKITGAYNLPCKYVIHTVGPCVKDKVTREDISSLYSCYGQCMEIAAEHKLKSIAFCCISTGVFHFPNELAASIAVDAVARFFEDEESTIEKVVFTVYKDMDREIYESLLGDGGQEVLPL